MADWPGCDGLGELVGDPDDAAMTVAGAAAGTIRNILDSVLSLRRVFETAGGSLASGCETGSWAASAAGKGTHSRWMATTEVCDGQKPRGDDE